MPSDPEKLEVRDEVATILPVINLPCAVVEAKVALVVAVSTPAVSMFESELEAKRSGVAIEVVAVRTPMVLVPIVALPKNASRVVSESKSAFNDSRSPEK